MRNWNLSILLGLALAAAACNPSDRRDAREQTKQDLEKAKQDLKKAQRELSKDYKEADRQTEKALSDARAKIHETLREQNVDRDKRTDPDKQ